MSKKSIFILILPILANYTAFAADILNYTSFGYQCGLSVIMPESVYSQIRENYRFSLKCDGKRYDARELANFYPIVLAGDRRCNVTIPEDKTPFDAILLAWINRGLRERHLSYDLESRSFMINKKESDFTGIYSDGAYAVFGYKIDDPDFKKSFDLYLVDMIDSLKGPQESPEPIIEFNGKKYNFISVKYYFGHMLDTVDRLLRDRRLVYRRRDDGSWVVRDPAEDGCF